MGRPSLSEAIEGRLISGESEIVPSEEEPVRAIDVLGPFAAVYRFSVDEAGGWYAECSGAVRSPEGTWKEIGRGGGHGGGWETSWRPSSPTFDGRFVYMFGSAGWDLPDEQGRMAFVRGIYGFVDPSVRALRVSTEIGDRTIDVISPVGAFVALVIGEAALRLQGLDRLGNPVGQTETHDAHS